MIWSPDMPPQDPSEQLEHVIKTPETTEKVYTISVKQAKELMNTIIHTDMPKRLEEELDNFNRDNRIIKEKHNWKVVHMKHRHKNMIVILYTSWSISSKVKIENTIYSIHTNTRNDLLKKIGKTVNEQLSPTQQHIYEQAHQELLAIESWNTPYKILPKHDIAIGITTKNIMIKSFSNGTVEIYLKWWLFKGKRITIEDGNDDIHTRIITLIDKID